MQSKVILRLNHNTKHKSPRDYKDDKENGKKLSTYFPRRKYFYFDEKHQSKEIIRDQISQPRIVKSEN